MILLTGKLFRPDKNWSTESKEITQSAIQRDGNGKERLRDMDHRAYSTSDCISRLHSTRNQKQSHFQSNKSNLPSTDPQKVRYVRKQGK